MKRLSRISLAVVAALLMSAVSGHAERFHGGGWGHGWGPGWGPAVELGLGLGLWGLAYPYYGYPYYPYYTAPLVQQPSAEIYVEPNSQQSVAPTYWFYCQDSNGYYPYVKKCPSGWMKVVPSAPPSPTPPGPEEEEE